jgi:phosphomethylpyrimidine synthase
MSSHQSPSSAPADLASAFPNSRKVHVDGPRTRVPMREVSLSGGEPPIRLYDTSGPQGVDVRVGLPRLRSAWIAERGGIEEVNRAWQVRPGEVEVPGLVPGQPLRALRGRGPVTQMHYARHGTVTPEMEFVAIREGFDPEFVRSEVARGRGTSTIPNSSRWPSAATSS